MLKLYKPQWKIICLLFITFVAGDLTTLNAQWEGWDWQQSVTINNSTGIILTDFQVKISLNSTNFDFAHAQSDGSDLRIADSDEETPLPFWIESWNSTNEFAVVWVKVPSIPIAGSTIYLYYGNITAPNISDGMNTFHSYDGFESYTLGTVPSSNAVNPGEWDRHIGNPILIPGASGSWDAQGATFASVIYDERVGEFRMYYHGYNSLHQVGLATSSDGINWTKYSGNPIVAVGSSGSWDATGVRVPMVWKEGTNDYRMIYTGSGTASGQIGYATSADGINWTKYAGNPVFNDPTWAHNQTENWGVMKVGSEYLMWYSTWGTRQSGIAVSTDLINWTPHTPGPIFATNGIPSDDRYSQFCPFSFKYNDNYYVLVPSYSSVGDYSKFYLYRSSSPYFPEADRTLVRVAHTPQGVDARDNDTPFVLTLDIERSIFPNDELRVYYAADPGSGSWTWSECLLIEPDIAQALSDAPLPSAGNLTWSGGTPSTVAVVNNPVRSSTQLVRITDLSSNPVSLTGTFAQLTQGIVGAWMRRSSTNLDNDFDIYLYDISGTTINSLNCVAGLGRENVVGQGGRFHYYNQTNNFVSTNINWEMDTWYLVTLSFDCNSNLYDFVVYDESMQEVVRVNDIGFGHSANSTAINRGVLYCGGSYVGYAYADDFRVCKWPGSDITSSVGVEIPNPLPVELNSFSASVNGSTVTLNWITETEVNNYGFEILRSAQNDNKGWILIGFVQGNGNSNSPKYYTFEDENLVAGIYSYRLKQIDTDGQFEYSKVVEVNLGAPNKFELSQNYPNPFNPSTVIEFSLPKASQIKVDLYNITGEKVATITEGMYESGSHKIEFSDKGGLPSGTYIYRLISDSFVQTKKMILLK
ncbi:MAG: DUF2341 domain-containing protein [bacterium]|nr:DUF2341 domain-containing protein [bacterium]